MARPFFAELDGVGAGHRGDLHGFEDVAAFGLGAEIEPQRGVDIGGVAGLDVEMPGKALDIVDRHEFVEPQREHRQRQPRRDQRLDLPADHRLVLAEAGVDQHGGVGLRQEVAVRHRKAARARRIRADPAVEGEGVLQRVELVVGKRGDAAGEGLRMARAFGGVLGGEGHDYETLLSRHRRIKGCSSNRFPLNGWRP